MAYELTLDKCSKCCHCSLPLHSLQDPTVEFLCAGPVQRQMTHGDDAPFNLTKRFRFRGGSGEAAGVESGCKAGQGMWVTHHTI